MESQRVRLLTKGYLRGWLDFKYGQKTSNLREEIVLHNIAQEEYEDIIREKLQRDSVLVAGSDNKTDKMFKSLDRTYNLYLGLKLPELAKELKIGDKAELPNQSIADMKALLAAAKLKSNTPTK